MKAWALIRSGKKLIKRWLPRSSRILSVALAPKTSSTVTVSGSPYGATYQAAGFAIGAGAVTTVPVAVTNTGALTWGAYSTFRLAYHWYQGNTLVVFDGRRTFLPTAVAPNGSLTLQATVQAPATHGTYTLKWDMVQEGVTWFSRQGVATGDVAEVSVSSISIEKNCAILSHIRELAQQGQRVAFDQALWSHAEVIRHYLRSFVLDNAGTDYIVPYVNDALPRFFHTLGFLPLKSGLRVLELGANPYLFSTLVIRFLDYETTYANFFGKSIYDTSVGSESQRTWSTAYGESHTFNYDTFNLELSEYPYPDESFDLVLFCEILEHLIIDPLKVFAAARRIIRPGGFLLLTTPNAVRLANVALVLAGSNFFDRYHPEFTVYGRHNREFTVEELQLILAGNGFKVLDITTLDRYNYAEPIIGKDNYEAPASLPYTQPQVEGWLKQIGASLDHRGDNIYVLAQRPLAE